jgi:hypothetical protein
MTPDATVWIFAYGSLIFRPGFAFTERRRAFVRGFARRFWQASPDHRGVPDAPGRVVTLVPAETATCGGCAYTVPAAHAAEVLDALDAPARSSKTLICGDYRESQEEVMVFGHGDRALIHGKGLLGTSLVAPFEVFGEATGMLLFEPQDHARLREATDWCMRYSTAKVKSEHEDITQRMMWAGDVAAVRFNDLRFMECDTPDEYAVLTVSFYPAVRALSA